MLSACSLASRGVPVRPLVASKAPRPSTTRRAVYATAATAARPAPPPLPPPPEKATLWHVLPYLGQLACAESRLVLRLSLAMLALLIAKGSGAGAHAPRLPPAALRDDVSPFCGACTHTRVSAHRCAICAPLPSRFWTCTGDPRPTPVGPPACSLYVPHSGAGVVLSCGVSSASQQCMHPLLKRTHCTCRLGGAVLLQARRRQARQRRLRGGQRRGVRRGAASLRPHAPSQPVLKRVAAAALHADRAGTRALTPQRPESCAVYTGLRRPVPLSPFLLCSPRLQCAACSHHQPYTRSCVPARLRGAGWCYSER